MLYGLPGVYYNGSLTIRHHITNSTSWDEKGPGGCGNEDNSPKTYEYPALFLAAKKGNSSDTNPFHWVLYGFQPADQIIGIDYPFLDVLQRWVQIRSSDFVISGTSYAGSWGGPRGFNGPNALYRNSDASNVHLMTRVYWKTEITDMADTHFSARAEFDNLPPQLWEDTTDRETVYASQYLTLSDVCAYNKTTMLSTFPVPISQIPKGNSYLNTTTPTIWLSTGATAEMRDVGADEMSFSLNGSASMTTGWVMERKAQCINTETAPNLDGYSKVPFERSYPWKLHTYEEYDKLLQLSVSISLSFKGSIVSENSTRVTGIEGGDLVFEAGYETPTPSQQATRSSSAGVSRREVWCSIMWTSSFFVTIMLLLI